MNSRSPCASKREARLAASLDHSHVVTVFDLVDEGDEQWLVMEYVDGRTLTELVQQRGPLDPDEAARLLSQAADALAALIAMLATLRDAEGNTTVTGLDNTRRWSGEPYPPEQFRRDVGALDGVSLLGSGSVSDILWARPAVTVLGIDCPPVVGSAAAIVPKAAARLNLRIPPGVAPGVAEPALAAHLRAAALWGVHVTVEVEATGSPFEAATDGPAYRAMAAAMQLYYASAHAYPATQAAIH